MLISVPELGDCNSKLAIRLPMDLVSISGEMSDTTDINQPWVHNISDFITYHSTFYHYNNVPYRVIDDGCGYKRHVSAVLNHATKNMMFLDLDHNNYIMLRNYFNQSSLFDVSYRFSGSVIFFKQRVDDNYRMANSGWFDKYIENIHTINSIYKIFGLGNNTEEVSTCKKCGYRNEYMLVKDYVCKGCKLWEGMIG